MRSARSRVAWLIAATLWAGLLPALTPGPAGAQAVGSATLVPIQVTGPASQRLNLIILGDGYTAAEIPKFREHVDLHLNVMWSIEPFRSYRSYFNIYALEIVSGVSGIRCDPENVPRGGDILKDTPLRLWFTLLGEPGGCADPNARGIQYGPAPFGSPPGTPDGNAQREMYLETYVEPALGIPASSQNVQTLALANTETYGGIGGTHATTSGASAQGPLITPHELGHSLGTLQDEYPYLQRNVPGGPHTGGEPSSIHHTLQTTAQMAAAKTKWWRWLGEESLSGGTIGAYESGMQKSSGIWRPSRHSMMRWLGYYFDQIGREHMTYRITGLRNANKMPLWHTTLGTVGSNEVVWVETPHPRFHELDVVWSLNGEVLPDTHDSRNLDLSMLDVAVGDTVGVTVSDPTDFVRDPAIKVGPRLSQSRQWTVGEPVDPQFNLAQITIRTPEDRPVAGDEVVYVETTHFTDRVPVVTWRLDGEVVPNPDNSRNLDLDALDLAPGIYELTAKVSDPSDPDGPPVFNEKATWTVDNIAPEVGLQLSEPFSVTSQQPIHYTYCERFTMDLTPTDDQPGHVVGEFRLRGEGWHHFYGWPDEPPGSPFVFTPSGTEIKGIIYGALSPGGMVWAPFESREPGYGTHSIEYRGIDAAGNIGEPERFQVTVLPATSPECLLALPH